ncbi:hypothetical protein AJ78_00584 [Emergomyces pasteurianus Ep9510]|uniref:Leucine-rich repeat domain-containing protein n=1 Tax=Emergomyces pasteurianus Ep9510 TaxID=1447872 RepID=A0A1J9PU39_9EURO|nr:hypothetical protein AJ78_00584 [Emergomyces pasteurianus Ep9510]
MGPSLESLPTEILTIIAVNLDTLGRRLSLLCTSRRLYDALLPELYRSIYRSQGNIVPLLRTILQKPWLAQMVRELRLPTTERSLFTSDEDLGYERWTALATAEPILRIAVEPFCNDDVYEQERWLRELQTCSPDALISLLVLSVPRLEKLELELPGYHYLSRVAKRSVGRTYQGNNGLPNSSEYDEENMGPIILPHLASVHMYWPRDTQIHVDLAFPFFQLPSIRYFSAIGFLKSEAEWKYKRQSQVTHIQLICCCLTDGAKWMIESCKNLQSFIYLHSEWDIFDESPGQMINPIPEIFRDSLFLARRSLETLCLDFSTDTTNGGTSFGTLGSLSEFMALKHLHLTASTLMPLYYTLDPQARPSQHLWEILPTSLETLHVGGVGRDHADEVMERLSSYVKSAPQHAPYLCQVLVIKGMTTLDNAAYKGFVTVGADTGVLCEFRRLCTCFTPFRYK